MASPPSRIPVLAPARRGSHHKPVHMPQRDVAPAPPVLRGWAPPPSVSILNGPRARAHAPASSRVSALLQRAKQLRDSMSHAGAGPSGTPEGPAGDDVTVLGNVLGLHLSPAEEEWFDFTPCPEDAEYLEDVLAGKYEAAEEKEGGGGDGSAHDSFIADLPAEFSQLGHLLGDP